MVRDRFDVILEGSAAFFRELQLSIVAGLEELESAGGGTGRFLRESWDYRTGGGGITCVLQDGMVFERAGVNYSRVEGVFSEEFAAAQPGEGRRFVATGVSLVIHPRNPYVPTVHANFRHITRGLESRRTAWFGGGADLTPYYPWREDVIQFHRSWREVCQRHRVADYERLKRWCDEYFFLAHRQEARGVGGIFFDYLDEPLDEVFDFVRDAGEAFLPAYRPIVARRMHERYGDPQRRWQLIRRGRYVEFNLLYDRGTAFGLKTGGRVESILMSLPPQVSWIYHYEPEPGSAESELLEYLKPRDWANEPT